MAVTGIVTANGHKRKKVVVVGLGMVLFNDGKKSLAENTDDLHRLEFRSLRNYSSSMPRLSSMRLWLLERRSMLPTTEWH